MASSSKKRTTMAKLNRESALRDKRIRKAARKEARRLEGGRDEITAPAEPREPLTDIGDPDPSGVGR
jgi:hypothetical protein